MTNSDGFEWPQKREEFILSLKEISESSAHNQLKNIDIDELIHFFFDDTELFDNPEEEVGKFIKLDEVKYITKMLGEFNSIINDLGEAPSIEYVSHNRWGSVKQFAQRILQSC